MISQSTINKVKEADMELVLRPYVQLKPNGSGKFMGCCPFHSERTPSFSVNTVKNVYNCFSCGAKGDIIKFIREKEGLSYVEAIEHIAKTCGIPIEYEKDTRTDEDKEKANKRSAILDALKIAQSFFVDQLENGTSSECEAARNYAYGRWSADFCKQAGIGYAPSDGKLFMEYCKRHGLSEEILVEAGLLKHSTKDDKQTYAFFRERVTIPIKSRSNQIISYTARYIGRKKGDDAPGKYLNTANTEVFVKSETIFGIANALKGNPDYFNVVEGAPDVLRLQSIGLTNTVATLGTAWSDNQFEQVLRYTHSICFIPDSDPPKGKNKLGAGFESVLKNGVAAMRLGFLVTVRELPFNRIPADDNDSTEEDENFTLAKNDADEHIRSIEDYNELEEVPFIIWMAKKRLDSATSLAEQRKYIDEIADALRFVKDKVLVDEYLTELSKIHGTKKSWQGVLDRAKGEAKIRAERESPSADSEREKQQELLRQSNLSILDNCFFTYDEDGAAVRLANFYLKSLYHIKDDTNGTRLFRMTNKYNESVVIEFRESELCSLTTFQQRVGSVGNFIWRAKIDKLNNVKEYCYRNTQSAERVRKMGWDGINEFFAFGNGIYDGKKFLPVDELGIVLLTPNKPFYIPATSKMYANNPELYQFERLFVHENRSGVRLYDFVEQLIKVFGDNAKVAFCYLLSTLFRDVVFLRTRHFPILNLFGEKGTGKTTLATSLQSFFIHSVDPPNLGVTSIPAMNDRVSQAVNSLVVFDEYKNDLDVRKIAYLKGLWGGGGQTKKNTNTDGMAAQTIISTGVALCGQDKPTQDMALFTRVLFLAFTKTSFSKPERDAYDDLVAMCSLGNTHLAIEVLSHRDLFEKNFANAYSMTKAELSKVFADEKIHDRIFGNWIIPLAAFRTLESVLELPFSYNDLLTIAVRGMRLQNETAQESSEMGDFWEALQGFHTQGRAIEKAHFRIKWHRTFRSTTMKEDMIFAEPTPVLYLNTAAVSSLFNGRSGNATANRSNWSTMTSYLRSHPSFLGLKQDRFTILLANGTPDYSFEMVNGEQVKKVKVNRPKALCFNYAMLKAEFGLNLETESVNDDDDDFEPLTNVTSTSAYVQEPSPTPPAMGSLFNDKTDDVPF